MEEKKINNQEKINSQQMINKSPINTLMASPDGVMIYMNDKSEETLRALEDYLPDKASNLVGKSIDWFHKNPNHQRKIIADPKNLPYKAIIEVGPETLDLLITAVMEDDGSYLGAMVSWDIVTRKLKVETEMERTQQMVDKSPINTMFCTPDGVMTYMNEATVTALNQLQEYLPAKVSDLVGNNIDWFHKNPEHQKNIIKDARNLPHSAIIDLGPEKLDLLVSPVIGLNGDYLGASVTWDIVTSKLKSEVERTTVKQMVDLSPINTLMATADGTMIYMNKASEATLRSIESDLPERVDYMIGKNVDIFHSNPAFPRKIFTNPQNLPHKAIIDIGENKASLSVSAVLDDKGNFLGPMVNWELITERVNLVTDLTGSSEELAAAANSLLKTANSLSAGAEETSAQANTASVASEEVNAGVQTVTSNMEEMTSAIKEITKTTSESSKMSADAMEMASDTNEIIKQLGESSMDIGNVIKVISSIAQQTNLLALNATIEAARAGEAGKGFAVVANEVKELAKQTAKATSEITAKIEAIQGDSKQAVTAIHEISQAIEKVNQFAGNIAASVEEQAATTNEVTRIVTESAEGVTQITENIGQVSQAAETTGKDAQTTQEAARLLGEMAETIKGHISKIQVN
jgi:methyl-accepting chemotaxis protein